MWIKNYFKIYLKKYNEKWRTSNLKKKEKFSNNLIFKGIPSFIIYLIIIDYIDMKKQSKKKHSKIRPLKKNDEITKWIYKKLGTGINIGNFLIAKYHEK